MGKVLMPSDVLSDADMEQLAYNVGARGRMWMWLPSMRAARDETIRRMMARENEATEHMEPMEGGE